MNKRNVTVVRKNIHLRWQKPHADHGSRWVGTSALIGWSVVGSTLYFYDIILPYVLLMVCLSAIYNLKPVPLPLLKFLEIHSVIQETGTNLRPRTYVLLNMWTYNDCLAYRALVWCFGCARPQELMWHTRGQCEGTTFTTMVEGVEALWLSLDLPLILRWFVAALQ